MRVFLVILGPIVTPMNIPAEEGDEKTIEEHASVVFMTRPDEDGMFELSALMKNSLCDCGEGEPHPTKVTVELNRHTDLEDPNFPARGLARAILENVSEVPKTATLH